MLFIFAYILHKLTQISHFQDIELHRCLHLSSTIFLHENTSFCIWFVEAVEAMWRQMNFASTILLSKYQLLTSINPQKWKYVGHFSNYSVRVRAREGGEDAPDFSHSSTLCTFLSSFLLPFFSFLSFFTAVGRRKSCEPRRFTSLSQADTSSFRFFVFPHHPAIKKGITNSPLPLMCLDDGAQFSQEEQCRK